MAKKYVKVYVNEPLPETHVRTYGGNSRDVREMVNLYSNMTKEEFLLRHPKFESYLKEGFNIILYTN